jgi:hypothetical protein
LSAKVLEKSQQLVDVGDFRIVFTGGGIRINQSSKDGIRMLFIPVCREF